MQKELRGLVRMTYARFAKTEQAKKRATVKACSENGISLLNSRRSCDGNDTAATSANCVMVMRAGEYSHPKACRQKDQAQREEKRREESTLNASVFSSDITFAVHPNSTRKMDVTTGNTM